MYRMYYVNMIYVQNVCMHACMYVCTYGMYVCMYVCIYAYMYYVNMILEQQMDTL